MADKKLGQCDPHYCRKFLKTPIIGIFKPAAADSSWIFLTCLVGPYLVLVTVSLQVESLKVQLSAASREKCHFESTISRLTSEIDRKVHSCIFHTGPVHI